MEGENPQKSINELKLFKIPINEYEKDMETESAKGKKNEILDLLNNYNKLRSEKEFKEIEDKLHEACKGGEIDLIKIYLSKTVENDSKRLQFKIDETNRTASLFKIKETNRAASIFSSTYEIEEVIIPRTVEHESVEYLITSITGTSKSIQSLKFVEDSAVETFYRYAFTYDSEIKEIYFPTSLKELKEKWCLTAISLSKIGISPSNGQFKIAEGKYLIGKSDSSKDEFDNILIVCRNINEFSIQPNIKIISPNAFEFCLNLKKVEIPPVSNLQIIGSNAFANARIEEFFIPSNVSKICECAFYRCHDLRKVEITTNSNLQTIESGAFNDSKIKEIYFPKSLKELKEGWCCNTDYLNKITISPFNGQFKIKEDKYLIGKSDSNKNEFDILLFACRGINEICIPSNIKIISSFAFQSCVNMKKVEIPPNSNLQIIEFNSFSNTRFKKNFIPSNVSEIGDHAFFNSYNLTKVEIPTNSNLQIIGKCAFAWTKIKGIFIPSKVSEINEKAFFKCRNLQIIEISEESKLKSFPLSALDENSECIIMIPANKLI